MVDVVSAIHQRGQARRSGVRRVWRGIRRDVRCQIDVGSEGKELVDAMIGVTPAVTRKQVAVEALRTYARILVGKEPTPSLKVLADIVARMDAQQIRALEALPQSLGSAATRSEAVVDTASEPQSEPEPALNQL
jgi:hypothetical protein